MIDNNEELKEIIRDIISKVARIDKNLVKDNSSLRKDLCIDSLQATQIVALIEEKFNIQVDMIEIFNVEILDDIIQIIKEKL